MTQTLANRMTTDTDQVFVACNPLQPQEEMLESRHMAETYGGKKPKPKGRIGLLLWIAYEVYEFVSEVLAEEEEPSCCCCCCCDD